MLVITTAPPRHQSPASSYCHVEQGDPLIPDLPRRSHLVTLATFSGAPHLPTNHTMAAMILAPNVGGAAIQLSVPDNQ